jgi:GNAT superfamily N-acetyltransferase
VVYRAIREDEFPAAATLFFDALEDLTARNNMPAPHRDEALVARGYEYVAHTGIFRVAVIEDRLVSLACAIVRDRVWFLSGFWTDPRERVRGIGGPLLRQVWDEGRRRGTQAHYVWSSPDFAALASYMKLGMLPGTQLFAFAGPPHVPELDRSLTTAALTPDRVASLDRALVGVRRDGDHAYWLARDGARGALVMKGREVVGYYHVHGGTIGPIGWSDAVVGDGVLGLALRDAASGGGDVQLTIPGMNHTAMRFALGSGLRLIRTSHLLWTEPIGDMERYVPSGPLLF